MAQRYEGGGAAATLKAFAVIVGVLAVVGAIALWSTASKPRGVNSTIVIAGFLVLGEGILLAVLTYAIGVTVDHLIAIRRQLDSLVPAGASIDSATNEPIQRPGTYRLVLVALGNDAAGVSRVLREQSNWHWSERELRRGTPGTILGSSLTEARARTLSEALAARGAVAEIEADTR